MNESSKPKLGLLDPIPEPWKYPKRSSKRFRDVSVDENLNALNNEGHNVVTEDFSDSPFHKKQQ